MFPVNTTPNLTGSLGVGTTDFPNPDGLPPCIYLTLLTA